MRIRSKPKNGSNLTMVFVFCIAVFFLVLGSLTVKSFLLLQASLFDGQHRFTVFVKDSKGESELISFAPDSKTIAMLVLPKGKNDTQKSVEKFLGIPVDGFIQGEKQYVQEEKDIPLFVRNLIFNYNRLQTNMTPIDLVRLWFFAKSVPTYSIVIQHLSTPVDQLVMDKRMVTLFSDNSVSQEKLSIQIINGTGVAGLGNRLARIITNMGGNVVVVSTANTVVKTSHIAYYGQQSYTAQKLNKILNASLSTMQKPEISDIIVTIGMDQASKF